MDKNATLDNANGSNIVLARLAKAESDVTKFSHGMISYVIGLAA